MRNVEAGFPDLRAGHPRSRIVVLVRGIISQKAIAETAEIEAAQVRLRPFQLRSTATIDRRSRM